MALLIRAS